MDNTIPVELDVKAIASNLQDVAMLLLSIRQISNELLGGNSECEGALYTSLEALAQKAGRMIDVEIKRLGESGSGCFEEE